MIDSHCHLDHEPLLNNINDVIKRSKNVGINKIDILFKKVEKNND